MAAPLPPNYLVDTRGTTRVEEFSWPSSPYSESVISPIVHQGASCCCYAITVSEATRAVINLKRGTNIPQLSAMEIFSNCHCYKCKGNKTTVALEWVVKEGLAEDKDMPLKLPSDPSDVPVKGKAKSDVRHRIDDWEPLPNCDSAMKSVLFKQPIVVSLQCPESLFTEYKKGLIDPYVIGKVKDAYGHSMLLVGCGYYLYRDGSMKYYWQLKNSMGERCGEKGYMYVLRNLSQPVVEKWVAFDPVVPICLSRGEIYDREKNLVVDMSLDELAKIDMSTSLDVIILFCERDAEDNAVNDLILRNFRRVSRLYLGDKDDMKFVRVELGEDDLAARMRYFLQDIEEYPVIKASKHGGSEGNQRWRDAFLCTRQTMLEAGEEEIFESMAVFFFKRVGGLAS